MLVLHKRWKKHNEIQFTKNKMNLNNRKLKIIHPHSSEESHRMTSDAKNRFFCLRFFLLKKFFNVFFFKLICLLKNIYYKVYLIM